MYRADNKSPIPQNSTWLLHTAIVQSHIYIASFCLYGKEVNFNKKLPYYQSESNWFSKTRFLKMTTAKQSNAYCHSAILKLSTHPSTGKDLQGVSTCNSISRHIKIQEILLFSMTCPGDFLGNICSNNQEKIN